jgi:DNA-binding SARP family transcriptional activator/DNA-binding XRE family transcriptional regulator
VDTLTSWSSLVSGLRNARERAGLTQTDLATRAGISVRTVRDLESGRVRRPRPTTLRRLATVIDACVAARGDVDDVPFDRLWPTRASGIRLRLLGSFQVLRDGEPVSAGSVRRSSLLAFLALHAPAPVRVDELLDVVWADADRPSQELLHTQVSRIRRLFAPDAMPRVERMRDAYRLVADPARHDLLAFREAARRAADATSTDPAAALRWWRHCWTLVRAEPLADLPALADHAAVVALRHEIAALAVRHADVALAQNAAQDSLGPLSDLLRADPLDEAIAARLIRVLAATDHQAAALRVYHRTRRELADELGVDPGDTLRDAYADVLRDRPRRGHGTEFAPLPTQARPPAQLPFDVPDFTGRGAELARLLARCGTADRAAPPVVVVSAAGGTGKTTLAVHLGHRLRESYPDGQLFAELRGASRSPVAPIDVLRGFLAALGVVRLPDRLDAASAMFRSLLADRRMLIVLDDAADAAQVRSLLPADAGCAVLITSRRSLADLVGADHLELPRMTSAECAELFGRIAGLERVTAERVATHRVCAACAGHPLAIRIAAARLAVNPRWTVRYLADLLSAPGRRIDELRVGDLAVRGSFRLSYDHLSASEARAFRMLGLWPGSDVSATMVAAMLDGTPAEAEQILESLADLRLIEHAPRDHYQMHDLIREYAAELAADDGVAVADAALDRVVGFAAATAQRAQHWLGRMSGPIDPQVVVVCDRALAFANHGAARAWLDAEVANLGALVDRAPPNVATMRRERTILALALSYFERRRAGFRAAEDYGRSAAALAEASGDALLTARSLSAIGECLVRQHRHDEAAPVLDDALARFRALRDGSAEAAVLGNMAALHAQEGRFDRAEELFRRSHDLFAAAGRRASQAQALANLGTLAGMRGELTESCRLLGEALAIAREVGESEIEINALINLGCALRELGELDEALKHLERCVSRSRADGARTTEGKALAELATVYQALGDRPQVMRCHQESLAIFREINAAYYEAVALTEIGRELAADGEHEQAERHWRTALRVFERCGAREAEDVRRLLATAPAEAGSGRRAEG